MTDFDHYSALSFDCYGTLIDWEAGIGRALGVWAQPHRRDLGADQLVAVFAHHESDVQTEQPALPYPKVLERVLRRVGANLGIEVTAGDARRFGASVGEWPAFSDSSQALRQLEQRFKLIILSNVDRESFRASNARLGVEFDLIVTAQDVGAYKPSDRSFPALFDRLDDVGVRRSELLHVAQSLFHDHEPAARVGLPSVWIDRRHDQEGYGATPPPQASVSPRWRYPSMAAFAAAALAG